MTIQQDIDRLFKQGLHDYSENPPNFVWDNIEHRLNKKRLKQKRNIVYSIAASVALLLSFGSGYMFTHLQKKQIADNFEISVQSEIQDNNDSFIDTENNKSVENKSEKHTAISGKTSKYSKNKLKPLFKPVNNNKIQHKNSKVKKVHSAGIVLSPMYAGTAIYDNIETPLNNEVTPNVNNKEEANTENSDDNETELKKIESRNVFLPVIEHNKELKYGCYNFDNYSYVEKEFSTKKTKSWGVGFGATPLFSFRTVNSTATELTGDNVNVFSGNYSNEKPFTAYSAGVNVNYKVAERWKINSGFYVSQTGLISEDIALNEVTASTNNDVNNNFYTVNTSNGSIYINGSPNELINRFSTDKQIYDNITPPLLPGQPELNDSDVKELDATFIQTYDYYEIPIVVSYAVIDRKLTMSLSGGLSTNIMYGNNVYFENDNTRYELDAKNEDLKSMSYSGIFGIGVEYPIIKNLNINLQPTLRYSLTPINNSGTVYPYSFGIYTGLKYDF
jgi:hypothetical protein